MIAYTTIAKLILRASNKVNGARPCECATAFCDALTRYVDNIRVEIDTKRAHRCKQPRTKTIAPGDSVCFD